MKLKFGTFSLGRTLTLSVNKFGIEFAQIEVGKRGILFWFLTHSTVRVIGIGKRPSFRSTFVLDSWTNDHCCMG